MNDAHRPFHIFGGDECPLAFLAAGTGRFERRLQTDIRASCRNVENDCKLPFRYVGIGVHIAECGAPVVAQFDIFHRATPAAHFVITEQGGLQGFASLDLQGRIECRADRKPLVKGVDAIFLNDLAAHFLSEIFRCENIMRIRTLLDAQRFFLGGFRFFHSDVAVFIHAIDHPVTAFDCTFRLAEGMIVVRPLRQRGEICAFGDGEFAHGLVEIGQRSAGNAVRPQAKENFVEIKFEDAILGISLLDTHGQDGFLDLAIIGLLRRQKEILSHLLRDRGSADGRRPEPIFLILVIIARAKPTKSRP